MVKQILTEQGVFNYQVNGNGPTLIFIHGFLESSAIWDSTVSKFSNGYKIINIDLPGHGLNHHLHSFYSLKHMAALVVTVLQQEKSLKPIGFGHSMGGYVGLEIEQIFSNRIIILLIPSLANVSPIMRKKPFYSEMLQLPRCCRVHPLYRY